jgi:NADPH-dependent glutamate synthase beta subunit-like oxidoreductase/CO/xanthine dehydrogenase FAD-binding subunit
MYKFDHANATSFEEAKDLLLEGEKGQNAVIAGGTDLMTVLRTNILAKNPDRLVNIKRINGGSIQKAGDAYTVGSLTTLTDVVKDKDLKSDAAAFVEAAHSVATPLVRNTATVGGNLCQDVRCWYYRYPEIAGGTLDCARKGGAECYAIHGENRYHSIFGGMRMDMTPCGSECPANTDVSEYFREVRNGDMDKAGWILMRYNPIPMVTGRVCAHLCETKCNRIPKLTANFTDEGVSVHNIERFVGDYILDHADVYYKKPKAETDKKIAVVGAGPAGLAAAYYLRKAGHAVTIFDKMEDAGGMLTYAIPHYRLPKSIVGKIIDAWKNMGIEFKQSVEVGKDIAPEDIESKFDKVFYATGAWERPVLGFDGEKFTEFGLAFLMEVNQWLNEKKREHVLVVGGGNVAMDVAVTAKRCGAKSVTLACLEAEGEMPASPEEVARAVEEGVNVMNSWGVKQAIAGKGSVTGMELKRCTSVFDAKGRFNPKYDEKETVVIDADSILMAAGQQVDLSFLKKDYDLAVERGRIKVDESQATSRKDVYAGGDAVSGPSTVVAAIRAGRNAAEAINEGYGVPAESKVAGTGFVFPEDDALDRKEPVKEKGLSAEKRDLKKEDTKTITLEEAVEESKRCLNCACYSVNASDLSPALIALDAEIITTKTSHKAADFFTEKLKAYEMLEPGELVTAVKIPIRKGYETGYRKFRVRKAIDFAIVSMATAVKKKSGTIKDISIVFGAVAPVPIVASEVNAFLKDKALPLDDRSIKKAVKLAVKNTHTLGKNGYKVQEIKAMLSDYLKSL